MDFLPPQQVVHLHNSTCPYCGTVLAGVPYDRDHVIGRRFVPRGKLNRSWNLIVRACVVCNRAKSQLEDDISALTMQPDGFGAFAVDEPALHVEAARKAINSISRRTNKRVIDSWETKTITYASPPGVTATFSMAAPPQLEPQRVAALARFHLAALFYWITFDSGSRKGGFWLGEGVIANIAVRRDWGNSIQRSFAALAGAWEHRIHAVAAGGYFKVSLRRHPTAVCWSWALEWNQNARIVGFLGEASVIQEAASKLTPPDRHVIPTTDNSILTMRRDVSLEETNDALFALDEREQPGT